MRPDASQAASMLLLADAEASVGQVPVTHSFRFNCGNRITSRMLSVPDCRWRGWR